MIKNTKKQIIIFLTLLSVAISSAFQAKAWVINTAKINPFDWLLQQTAKPSVYHEMSQFFIQRDPETDARNYVNSFIPSMHQMMVHEAKASLDKKLNEPSCKPALNISYPVQVTQQYDFPSKINFEQEIIKIQTYDCLGKLDLHKVFETLMSEEFQKVSIDGLKGIKTDQSTNEFCQNISMFPLGRSNVCFKQNILFSGRQYILHSYNDENIDQPTVPVYYREAISVITQLPNGEVSLYNLGYGRGPDLPFHSLIEKLVLRQHKSVMQSLVRMAQ